ncbi:moronecidin-like [Kryptolebias marmoratus]|uniref:moronecidin-like n=1 Tax=Kryptolebias marmoratus TaxID=37003 RepID=UPI0007F8BDB2|nr:moronecidin-like [Kryptolebias marmoratus]XP_017293652.1 moronecidin-like [Kryptolebias marmoratus]
MKCTVGFLVLSMVLLMAQPSEGIWGALIGIAHHAIKHLIGGKKKFAKELADQQLDQKQLDQLKQDLKQLDQMQLDQLKQDLKQLDQMQQDLQQLVQMQQEQLQQEQKLQKRSKLARRFH